jgi:hypothetical protein
MNPIIEHDITHIVRVMRASVFHCASEIMLIEYWRNRLQVLCETPSLTRHQRHLLLELLRELSEIEARMESFSPNKETEMIERLLGLRERAEFLTYLVAVQVLARNATGHWLPAGSVVAAERIWMDANGDIADWLERVSIASWSQRIAERVDSNLLHGMDTECVASILSVTPKLDFRATFVRTIYHDCLDHLTTMGWFIGGRTRPVEGGAQ